MTELFSCCSCRNEQDDLGITTPRETEKGTGTSAANRNNQNAAEQTAGNEGSLKGAWTAENAAFFSLPVSTRKLCENTSCMKPELPARHCKR
jgi:hypothetical protein